MSTITSHTRPTLCRLCVAHCGVLATVEEGRLVKVEGDPDNPMFKGYSCPKGRALPEMHNSPHRLLRSQKKQPDGQHAPIAVEQAMDEVADKIRRLVDEYGPRSVAMYVGTNALPYPPSGGVGNAFMRAIGSPMFFTSNTIDQPGKQIAAAAHGHWLGGDINFEQADTWMLVGVNPVITKSAGIPGQNPAQKLKDAEQRGMQLIVIDPRVSETAKRAQIHIRPRPGEDPTILAGMIRIIIDELLYDKEFIRENVEGFEALKAHVAPFTPAYVAERADIPEEQLIEAARLFATGGKRGGAVNTGSGSSFSMHANVVEYLALCLNTLCGRWVRAGEAFTHPNAMLPAVTPKAQAYRSYRGWGYGEKLRVRNLRDAACGMPTSALADEILLEGEGQVKALICVGGNPMAAWPDQRKTQEAMEKLELLITLDIEMSSTARMADYIIAPKMTLETPGMSQGGEMIKYFGTGLGFPAAYGQYSPRIVETPEHSDLIEEWEFFHGLGCRMDLDLLFVVYYGFSKFMEAPPILINLNKDYKPTTEELFEKMCESARIPFSEVCEHPHGKVFDVTQLVQEKDADCETKLQLGNNTLLDELAEIAASDYKKEHNNTAYPYRLIPRRHNNFINSSGRSIDKLNGGKLYNPAFIHPDDMATLGFREGDSIRISTQHDAIPAIVEADANLRRGLVAMVHAFGGLVDEDDQYLTQGSNTGRLVRADVDYDPLTGMPRMGNIPVNISAITA